MRVLIVIPFYRPASVYGGPIVVAEEQARRLVAGGHAVEVATTDLLDSAHRVPAPHERVLEGVRVRYFRNLSHRLGHAQSACITPGLYRWLSRNTASFDVVHVHDYYTYQTSHATRAAARAGVACLVQPHGSLPPIPELGRQLRRRAFNAVLGRRIWAETTLMLALCPAEERELVACGVPSGKIRILPNGIEPGAPVTAAERAAARRELGWGPQERVLLFLGRLHHKKGLLESLAAFRILVHDEPAVWRWAVAGPDFGFGGEWHAAAARSECGERIAGLGPVEGLRKRMLLAGADAFILCSRHDTFPVAPLEALAHGLPVVLSPQVGFGEWLHPPVGWVVPGADAAAIAGACRDAAEARREDFASTQDACHAWIDEHVAWPRIMARLLEHYAEARTLARRAGPPSRRRG